RIRHVDDPLTRKRRVGHDRRGGAVSKRLSGEGVTVESLAFEGEEKRTRNDVAGIRADGPVLEEARVEGGNVHRSWAEGVAAMRKNKNARTSIRALSYR